MNNIDTSIENEIKIVGRYANLQLGDYSAEVPNYRNWNGQIHTFEEVMNLYKHHNKI